MGRCGVGLTGPALSGVGGEVVLGWGPGVTGSGTGVWSAGCTGDGSSPTGVVSSDGGASSSSGRGVGTAKRFPPKVGRPVRLLDVANAGDKFGGEAAIGVAEGWIGAWLPCDGSIEGSIFGADTAGDERVE
jgi:hypothetical protein